MFCFETKGEFFVKKKTVFAVALVLLLGLFCTACGQREGADEGTAAQESGPKTGGVLYLSVNPEIAVFYDIDGNVIKVEGCNDDGSAILEDYTGYEGKAAGQVVTELVAAIGEAGYLVEEIEGESRKITIEIETGSVLPNDTFLEEMVSEVRACVNEHDWDGYVDVEGGSNYGIKESIPDSNGAADDRTADPALDDRGASDYHNTDYGPGSDGVTDYDNTDYGPNSDGVTDYSHTDYNDTDYGPGSDGVTDYNDTDYGPGSDGVTNYNDTDYGPGSDGVTNYNDTDYGPGSDGVTDYNDTDYGPGSDGVTDYNSSDYHHTDYHASDYEHTNYHNSDYDDSDYDS